MKNILLVFLPYYYSIRSIWLKNLFNNTIFINFWIICYTFFVSHLPFNELILNYALYLWIFMLFYEIWYIINDNISILFEKNPRKWSIISWKLNIFISLVFRALIWVLILFLFRNLLNFATILLLLFSILVFLLHNFIKEEYRFTTFFLLRILKWLFPIYFAFQVLGLQQKLLVLWWLIIIWIIATIPYTIKKLWYTRPDFWISGSLYNFLLLTSFVISLLSIIFNIHYTDGLMFILFFIWNILIYNSTRYMKIKLIW
jgi:hypothetical protein